MDISPFIQTAFGAIVGGGILLVTNRLTAKAEKRRAIQEWYEQFYVTDGTNRLIVFFKSLQLYQFSLKDFVGEVPPLITKIEDVPTEVLTRVEALLQEDHFTQIMIFVYPALGSEIEGQRKAAGKAISEALQVLYGLRNAFLKDIPKLYYKHQSKVESNIGTYMNKVNARLWNGLVGAYYKSSHASVPWKIANEN